MIKKQAQVITQSEKYQNLLAVVVSKVLLASVKSSKHDLQCEKIFRFTLDAARLICRFSRNAIEYQSFRNI